MRRYLLFAGYNYESSGGADDLVGDYASLDEAIAARASVPDDQWAHVLDTRTGEVTKLPGVPREPCSRDVGKIACLPASDRVPGVSCEIVFRKDDD